MKTKLFSFLSIIFFLSIVSCRKQRTVSDRNRVQEWVMSLKDSSQIWEATAQSGAVLFINTRGRSSFWYGTNRRPVSSLNLKPNGVTLLPGRGQVVLSGEALIAVRTVASPLAEKALQEYEQAWETKQVIKLE